MTTRYVSAFYGQNRQWHASKNRNFRPDDTQERYLKREAQQKMICTQMNTPSRQMRPEIKLLAPAPDSQMLQIAATCCEPTENSLIELLG